MVSLLVKLHLVPTAVDSPDTVSDRHQQMRVVQDDSILLHWSPCRFLRLIKKVIASLFFGDYGDYDLLSGKVRNLFLGNSCPVLIFRYVRASKPSSF